MMRGLALGADGSRDGSGSGGNGWRDVGISAKGNIGCYDGVGGGFQGVGLDLWEASYKVQFSTREDTHDYNSAFRYSQHSNFGILT